ncbi:MAG: hypothetical protein VX730_07300 [Pseudomonadota bacterium]|nr:hypothetical protein [Pseudomonadota bacterium]
MSRTPKRNSYSAVVRLLEGWVNWPYAERMEEGQIERFRLYNEETAQALLKGAGQNAKGADKILFQHFMRGQLTAEEWRKPFDDKLDDTDPRSFAFARKLVKFCMEELDADKTTTLKVLKGFARYPLKEQKRLAAELPESVGGIGYLLDEHRDWLMLFHCYGNLYFQSLRLEFQDV